MSNFYYPLAAAGDADASAPAAGSVVLAKKENNAEREVRSQQKLEAKFSKSSQIQLISVQLSSVKFGSDVRSPIRSSQLGSCHCPVDAPNPNSNPYLLHIQWPIWRLLWQLRRHHRARDPLLLS